MDYSTLKEMKAYLQFSTENNIYDLCSSLYPLGVTGFSYGKLYPNGTYIDLSTNLNLAEYYLQKFYGCEYMPSDMQCNYLANGINLWEMNKANRMLADCREVFNIGNGLTLSQPNTLGYTELFFYYSDANNYKINYLYLNQLDVFKNFALFFKEKAKKLIQKAEPYKITTPDYYQELYTPDEVNNSVTSIKTYYSQLDIKKFYLKGDTYLTYKEAECLNFYARGMTVKETAKILQVSIKTIETHLDKIKHKLNCFSKAQLTQIAVGNGVLEFFKDRINYS